MTREEAIEYLKRADTTVGKKIKTRTAEAIEMAIKALEQIDKIKQIIAIDNSVIQEDVMKYKMICEVVEK